MIDFNGCLGRYNIPFFCVHLNSDGDFSSYVHEYVHHIQNITTTYGMVYYFCRQCYFLSKFINNQNSYYYPNVNRLWKKNQKQIERVFWDLGSANPVYELPYHYEKVVDIEFSIKKEKYHNTNIPYIYGAIFRLPLCGKTYSIPFSVLMIKENMARLIQNRCFPDSKIAYNVTYFLIEELVQNFVDRYSLCFPVNSETILALCDLSLYGDFPIHAFFSILMTFGKMNKPDISPAYMYDYFFNSTIYTLHGQFSPQELLTKELEACCASADAFYKVFAPDTTINEWAKHLFRRGISYRINNPDFLLRVMDPSKTPHEAKESFMEIVQDLGFAVDTIDGIPVRVPKELQDRDFAFLMALEEFIFQSLHPNNSGCQLQGFCKNYHIRNDTKLVGDGQGNGLRSFKVSRYDKNNYLQTLIRAALSDPVVNESCKNPRKRDLLHNLCPYTYIARNVEQANNTRKHRR